MTKLVILDRDGVINYDSTNYIKTVKEFIAIDSSINVIAKLNQNGFIVAIATNQSGIGRGFYTLQTLEQMHAKLRAAVLAAGGELGEIKYCPHLPSDNCLCRKPKPKMLLDIIAFYKADAMQTYFVGDSFSDIKCAINANCIPVLAKTGKGKKTLQNNKLPINCLIFNDLAEFANYLIYK